MGAKRLISRFDCDRDYEAAFAEWSADLQRSLGNNVGQEVVALIDDHALAGYSAVKPFPAKVTENRRLSKLDSEKETRHFEFEFGDSGVTYEPGDALGVIPENDPDVVEAVMELLDASPDETMPNGLTVRRALTEAVELRFASAALRAVLDNHDVDDGCDVYDLLKRHAATRRLRATDLISLAATLQPRLYSIASSPLAYSDAAHLCVATVRYRRGLRSYKGVASTYLADRVMRHQRVPVFVRRNPRFRLPADNGRPIIMIGPGTGVAPFHAFLQHRAALNATGHNWLFFGDQRCDCDYLYQQELQAHQRSGLLTRLDTAFSRDQAESVYVQHLMRAAAPEIRQWLSAGAAIYVCGDAREMARDVDHTLQQIIAVAASIPADRAAEYLQAMQRDGRYQRDIY